MPAIETRKRSKGWTKQTWAMIQAEYEMGVSAGELEQKFGPKAGTIRSRATRDNWKPHGSYKSRIINDATRNAQKAVQESYKNQIERLTTEHLDTNRILREIVHDKAKEIQGRKKIDVRDIRALATAHKELVDVDRRILAMDSYTPESDETDFDVFAKRMKDIFDSDSLSPHLTETFEALDATMSGVSSSRTACAAMSITRQTQPLTLEK